MLRFRSKYRNYWGSLPQFQAPVDIVQNGTLVLSGNALAALLVILDTARSQQHAGKPSTLARVRMVHKTLTARTGFSKNTITQATKELEASMFIKGIPHNRRKRGEFGANEYLVCNPRNGQPIPALGRNLLFENRIGYLNFPKCFVREIEAAWALRHLSSSEIRLFASIVHIANRERDGQFSLSDHDLRTMACLSRPTFANALEALRSKCLISVRGGKHELSLVLCDPYTGEPLCEDTARPEDNPRNYFVTEASGRAKRMNLNTDSAEGLESLLRASLGPDAEVVDCKNGDLLVQCPFHFDQNPSCSVNPGKRCFYCHGCTQKGTLTEFLTKVTGVTRAEIIERTATALGINVEFRKPDRTSEAIYSYEDRKGKLMKQVLRYPGKEFSQRQPARGGGWVWNTAGVPPVLYNLSRLQFAKTVFLTEGEKDAETLMKSGLRDSSGHEIVATTSGGADSWHDELADDLLGKRVIVDADEAGARYGAAVALSLKRRGIEHRSLSFESSSAKDVTDFLRLHSVAELCDRIGADWIITPSDAGWAESAVAV